MFEVLVQSHCIDFAHGELYNIIASSVHCCIVFQYMKLQRYFFKTSSLWLPEHGVLCKDKNERAKVPLGQLKYIFVCLFMHKP